MNLTQCKYWKDFGFDDGGEVCVLSKQKTICQANAKDCKCSELLDKTAKIELRMNREAK